MLKALLNGKRRGIAIEDYEDVRTSSVFGMLIYLPDNLLVQILNDLGVAIPSTSSLELADFWPRLLNGLEPDVVFRFDTCICVIEVKRRDDSLTGHRQGQILGYVKQLRSENPGFSIHSLAIGGARSDESVHQSWGDLQKVVDHLYRNSEKDPPTYRILKDILHCLEEFKIRPRAYFDSLNRAGLSQRLDRSIAAIQSLFSDDQEARDDQRID